MDTSEIIDRIIPPDAGPKWILAHESEIIDPWAITTAFLDETGEEISTAQFSLIQAKILEEIEIAKSS